MIGLVLGPILEESLRQGLIMTDGNFLEFLSFSHPIALVLLLLAGGIVAASGYSEIRRSLLRPAKPKNNGA